MLPPPSVNGMSVSSSRSFSKLMYTSVRAKEKVYCLVQERNTTIWPGLEPCALIVQMNETDNLNSYECPCKFLKLDLETRNSFETLI